MSKKELETSLIMPVTPEFVERRIRLVRGQKVMLDNDLAELYQVPTKRLNEQVRRNIGRFPKDFMFQLSSSEITNLNPSQFAIGSANRSQIATGSQKHRDPRFRPYVFTELGVAMLSSVLNSDRAVQMNICIMRAFVKLREFIANDKELSHKIETLMRTQKTQAGEITSLILVMSKMRKDVNKLIKEKIKLKSAIGFDA